MYHRNLMIRRWLILITIFCLLVAGGCSKPGTSNAGVAADTVTVTDCIGRQVQIPAQINRIACLCPEAGYALAMFGQGDKIVAVVGGIQRDLILTDMYPRIKDLPVPKGSGGINIEELVKTEPDVVFVKTDTSSNEAEVNKLNKSKIPFLVVDYNSMQEQQKAIAMIGKAVGAEDQAAEYIEYYQDNIDMVQSRVKDISQQQKVRVYHSINEATRTDVQNSLSVDWTQAAGANNVVADENLKNLDGKYYASLEQIFLWDPDVILVNELGVANYILTNSQWAPIKAVQTKRVYQMPNGISRWGHPSSPETPLAVLWLAHTIYPDKFTDLDMAAETRDFYKKFFNFDLADDVVNQILFGEGMRTVKK